MKRVLIIFALAAFAGAASGQSQTEVRRQPDVTVSEVAWRTDNVLPQTYSTRDSYGKTGVEVRVNVRVMSVTVTNTGRVPVESIRLAFVFKDPDTGEVMFRYKARRKKFLLPGESASVVKAALPYPWGRDEAADRSAVVTEVKYSDGSVWRDK